MPKYHVTVQVKEVEGNQIWEIDAETSDLARQGVKDGRGDIVEEEIEVTGLDWEGVLDDVLVVLVELVEEPDDGE